MAGGEASRLRVLVADIGNSRARLALWEGEPVALCSSAPGGGAAERLVRLDELPTPRDDETRGALASLLARRWRAEGAAAVVLCSVVPDCDAAIASGVASLIRIDHTMPLPFGLDVTEPSAVGADRYCNLAAAVRAGWRDALIIDAGTATTIDLLHCGRFAGGLIAPGMAYAAQKLGEFAARLSPVPFEACPLAVGRDTESAMRAGAFHVGVLGVVETAERVLTIYGDRPVVVTGGLGSHLRRPGWRYDPDWTLQGAVHLAAGQLHGGA